MKNPILQIQDLSIGYKESGNETVISREINVDFEKGKLIAIVGANGVGKSTLLRTLSNLQPVLSGSIKIDDQPLDLLKPVELAAKLSLVLTEQIASKNLTVSEIVGLGRQPYTNWLGKLSPKDKELIEQSLAATHTLELADRKCHQLSDGQFQKVMIARALAQETPLIILDEPTTHLDMYHKAYILNLLKNLCVEFDKTIIFSTHEIELALQLSDNLLVMQSDKVQFGTPNSLIETGVFESLFPNDLIVFDKKTASFKVKK
ncbi:ABC transporter ATP-binding protein [Spongiivirga citrea]|uniref:ATP-binding cassette domain-containing protein n=1 Tax=Spongiivirga citrea TaxID=1481457 RepID=A0A6M0CSJ6_9FLAO|nr:ABC transporter ATP-binding protein [Spongiivirga citrea]NER18467.1 ATP-binding cassette domain-containing protein [Spongiivirga citrea]